MDRERERGWTFKIPRKGPRKRWDFSVMRASEMDHSGKMQKEETADIGAGGKLPQEVCPAGSRAVRIKYRFKRY